MRETLVVKFNSDNLQCELIIFLIYEMREYKYLYFRGTATIAW
jgi:hypothetical protein